MKRLSILLFLFALAACAGGGSNGPLPSTPSSITKNAGVVDQSATSCSVSADNVIWYTVPSGGFSPIDAKYTNGCTGLSANRTPAVPSWAKPNGPTQAIFVAASLEEDYQPGALQGMQMMEQAVSAVHIPMTWMIGDPGYLANASLYQQYHTKNGDDVESEDDSALTAQMRSLFPWYTPTISIDGAGRERDPQPDLSRGETAFWGIAWNQSAIDGTDDVGAPWGTYCADPTSYKRPEPDGGCKLLAFEWTARDLTRVYLSGQSADYSTDPDDLELRAGFTAQSGAQYVRQIVDAYAAAGQTQPIVMIGHDEPQAQIPLGDQQQILSAMYQQAAADGMKAETMPQVSAGDRTSSAAPRAIAFPFIPGGHYLPSLIDGGTLYPATIDFHDTQAGMSFLAGHTMPSRVFRYSDDSASYFNIGFSALPASAMPTLQSASVASGSLVLQFQSPAALHYGIALWSNPATLGLSGPNVHPAGRAGAVVTFDLQPGVTQISIPCGTCTGTTLPYAGT